VAMRQQDEKGTTSIERETKTYQDISIRNLFFANSARWLLIISFQILKISSDFYVCQISP
jgi:hypothetical protein